MQERTIEFLRETKLLAAQSPPERSRQNSMLENIDTYKTSSL